MSNQPSSTNTAPLVEQLGPHATCEWVSNRRILIMTSADSSRATIDAWTGRAKEIIQSWPAQQPFCLIIDASNPNVSRTPYSRSKLKELNTLRSDIKWYIALIPPKTYLMQLMKLGLALPVASREMQIFFNREEAVKWLESKLTP